MPCLAAVGMTVSDKAPHTAPVEPAAVHTGPVDSEGWRSLHPLSLVANLLPQTWRTARGLWPLLLALFVGGGSMGTGVIDTSLIIAFFGLALTRTLVHFLTLRYRVHDGHFEVRSGLINRRARALDPTRIQNIEKVQNLFHKAVGLVEVRVETAGDASTQGLLSAVSVDEAARLQAELKALVSESRGPSDATPETPQDEDKDDSSDEQILVEGSIIETLAYGLSRRTVGTVAVLTAIFMEVFGRLGPSAAETRWALQPSVLGPAAMLAFAASWGWSAGRALLRHWRFRLSIQGDRLINEEGLTTRRRVEIPVRKVQLVRADEPWMRRFMGYGSVLIETAALGFADGEVRQAEGVIPMVAKEDLPTVVQAATPSVIVNPWTVEWRPAHWRALYRTLLGGLGRAAIGVGIVVWFAGAWGWLALLGVPVLLAVDWLEWRRQGWVVTPDSVMTRRGVLRRSTSVLDRAKIQSVQIVATPLMRWHGLGRVVVRVAGTAVALPDIKLDEALAVFQDLSQSSSHHPSEAA